MIAIAVSAFFAGVTVRIPQSEQREVFHVRLAFLAIWDDLLDAFQLLKCFLGVLVLCNRVRMVLDDAGQLVGVVVC